MTSNALLVGMLTHSLIRFVTQLLCHCNKMPKVTSSPDPDSFTVNPLRLSVYVSYISIKGTLVFPLLCVFVLLLHGPWYHWGCQNNERNQWDSSRSSRHFSRSLAWDSLPHTSLTCLRGLWWISQMCGQQWFKIHQCIHASPLQLKLDNDFGAALLNLWVVTFGKRIFLMGLGAAVAPCPFCATWKESKYTSGLRKQQNFAIIPTTCAELLTHQGHPTRTWEPWFFWQPWAGAEGRFVSIRTCKHRD